MISPPPAAPAASLSHVTRTHGSGASSVVALDDVSLELEAGAFTAVMGPSGSGKSTLLHLVGGLDTPSAGTVAIGGQDVTALDDDALTVLRRRRLGFVFQSFNLVPSLTVEENVLLPAELDGRRIREPERRRAAGLLARLRLADRATHRPAELSGGQQQRVAIARALLLEPELLVADEPTGSLDSRSSREVLDLLVAANRDEGRSIVMVTHDPLAASRAGRIVFLADGRVVDDRGAMDAEEVSRTVLGLERAA